MNKRLYLRFFKSPPFYIFRRQIYLFFLIFLGGGAVILGILTLFYQSENQTRLSQLKIQEKYSVDLQSYSVETLFDSIVADLSFLASQNNLREYLDKTPSSFPYPVAYEYLNLSRAKKIYDQIRFLDLEGMEIVRVNYNQGVPFIVPQSELQSKIDRYYFYECCSLDEGEVFISPFDLNIEHGEIETPQKPMIRIGSPVFDSRGQKKGIVLLNYLGIHLIQRLLDSEQVSAGDTMLLNSQGYWMLSPDRRQEWGFMYDDPDRSFAYTYPEIWEELQKRGSGQVVSSRGLFTFKTIQVLETGLTLTNTRAKSTEDQSVSKSGSSDYPWFLVSFVPREVLNNDAVLLKSKLLVLGTGLFVFVAVGSWFFAFTVTRKRIMQEQLNTMAHYDELTGLPNRRLFFDRLNTLIRQGSRYEARFGLLYIDLDGFKKINDTYGHSAGDELLTEVANRMTRLLRESDTAARLGGDEFAVILGSLNSREGAQTAALKIISALSDPINLAQAQIQIGASIGISLFPEDSINGDELVKKADAAMYMSKYGGKNRVSFYSDGSED